DPHICFVQPPADAHGTLATMKGLLQQRDILQHPAIDRGMVDLDAPFFHHLLELTVADRICDVPAYAPEDDVPLKMAAFKIDHRGLSSSEAPAIRTRDRVGQNLATEPLAEADGCRGSARETPCFVCCAARTWRRCRAR